MAKPHVIRLRGPWKIEPLERYLRVAAGQYRRETHGLPAGGKVPVPGDWSDVLGSDFRGAVRYTRHFNCPTNLDARERVWLVCEGVDHRGDVALNGYPLCDLLGLEFARADITEGLQPHNTLVVDVTLLPEDHPDAPPRHAGREGKAGGLIGEVRLEIRRGDV
jgi:beta-galactosidase/beta-glucuronidase